MHPITFLAIAIAFLDIVERLLDYRNQACISLANRPKFRKRFFLPRIVNMFSHRRKP